MNITEPIIAATFSFISMIASFHLLSPLRFCAAAPLSPRCRLLLARFHGASCQLSLSSAALAAQRGRKKAAAEAARRAALLICLLKAALCAPRRGSQTSFVISPAVLHMMSPAMPHEEAPAEF